MAQIILDMQRLARAIASVLPAASRDKDRRDIFGVNLSGDGANVTATATDEHVTARYMIDDADQADRDFRILVPRPRAVQLLAIIGDAEGECTVTRDETLFYATFEAVGEFRFVIQGVEVPFPLAAVDEQWPAGSPVSDRDLDLDPALASRVKKAFAAAGADGALRFELHGPDAALVVRHEDVPELEALILPHTEDSEDGAGRQPGLFGSDDTGDGGCGETAEDREEALDAEDPDKAGEPDNGDPIIRQATDADDVPLDGPDVLTPVCGICRRARATQPAAADRPAMCDACTAAATAAYGKPKKRTPIRPNKARKPAGKKPAKKGKRK